MSSESLRSMDTGGTWARDHALIKIEHANKDLYIHLHVYGNA